MYQKSKWQRCHLLLFIEKTNLNNRTFFGAEMGDLG